MQDWKEMLKKTQNDSTKTVMSERCKAVIKIHKMTPNKNKLITLKQGCSWIRSFSNEAQQTSKEKTGQEHPDLQPLIVQTESVSRLPAQAQVFLHN